jgi:hypothetical protein
MQPSCGRFAHPASQRHWPHRTRRPHDTTRTSSSAPLLRRRCAADPTAAASFSQTAAAAARPRPRHAEPVAKAAVTTANTARRKLRQRLWQGGGRAAARRAPAAVAAATGYAGPVQPSSVAAMRSLPLSPATSPPQATEKSNATAAARAGTHRTTCSGPRPLTRLPRPAGEWNAALPPSHQGCGCRCSCMLPLTPKLSTVSHASRPAHSNAVCWTPTGELIMQMMHAATCILQLRQPQRSAPWRLWLHAAGRAHRCTRIKICLEVQAVAADEQVPLLVQRPRSPAMLWPGNLPILFPTVFGEPPQPPTAHPGPSCCCPGERAQTTTHQAPALITRQLGS